MIRSISKELELGLKLNVNFRKRMDYWLPVFREVGGRTMGVVIKGHCEGSRP